MPNELKPGNLEEPLLQVLAVLKKEQEQAPPGDLTALDLSKKLLNEHGVTLHWRTIEAELRDHKRLVYRKKPKNKQALYRIMNAGLERLEGNELTVRFINPSQATEHVIEIHAMLGTLTGKVAICDPYLNSQTLHFLRSIPLKSEVHLLTKNVHNTGEMMSLLDIMKFEGHKLTIRTCNKSIHDRYLIDKKGLILLGSSLNSIGKNQSFCVKLGQDLKSVVEPEFWKLWSSSAKFHE